MSVASALTCRARNALKLHLRFDEELSVEQHDIRVDRLSRSQLRKLLRSAAFARGVTIQQLLLQWHNCGTKTAYDICDWIDAPWERGVRPQLDTYGRKERWR